MAAPRIDRRLTAVLAADVVGYSRLVQRDEQGTLGRLKAHRGELIEPLVAEHGGRVVKLMGDGILCEFPSAVHALAGGPLFGLVVYSAFALAPLAHATVFPPSCVMVTGMVLSVLFLGERPGPYQLGGGALLLLGLLALAYDGLAAGGRHPGAADRHDVLPKPVPARHARGRGFGG